MTRRDLNIQPNQRQMLLNHLDLIIVQTYNELGNLYQQNTGQNFQNQNQNQIRNTLIAHATNQQNLLNGNPWHRLLQIYENLSQRIRAFRQNNNIN